MEKDWSVENLIVALFSVQKALPIIDYKDWTKIKANYVQNLTSLLQINGSDEDQIREIVVETMKLLSDNNDFLLCFSEEVNAISSIRSNLWVQIQDLKAETDQTVLLTLLPNIEPNDNARIISLMPGGVGGAKSIKLKNIRSIDIATTFETLAGILMVAGEDKYHANLYVVIAGILLIIQGVLKLSFQKMEEREASVLWGFYKAKNKAGIAPESLIVRMTNSERTKYGYKELNEADVTNALYTLMSYKCVSKVDRSIRQWKLVEKILVD